MLQKNNVSSYIYQEKVIQDYNTGIRERRGKENYVWQIEKSSSMP